MCITSHRMKTPKGKSQQGTMKYHSLLKSRNYLDCRLALLKKRNTALCYHYLIKLYMYIVVCMLVSMIFIYFVNKGLQLFTFNHNLKNKLYLKRSCLPVKRDDLNYMKSVKFQFILKYQRITS